MMMYTYTIKTGKLDNGKDVSTIPLVHGIFIRSEEITITPIMMNSLFQKMHPYLEICTASTDNTSYNGFIEFEFLKLHEKHIEAVLQMMNERNISGEHYCKIGNRYIIVKHADLV